jgi:hypothetical protein
MSLTLHSLKKKLKLLDLRQEIQFIIDITSEDLAELNREQLWKGQNAKGLPIKPPYSNITIFYKRRKSQPIDRVTLKDTGDFYSSINVDVKRDTFTIFATDDKTNKLTRKYGKSILGLQEESKSRYVKNVLFPALKKRIYQVTGLRF